MEANNRQPGDSEAAAAIAGMQEVYGLRSLDDCYGRTKHVGEWITWRREDWPGGRTSSSKIHAISAGVFIVEHDGDLASVTPGEVMPL
jgi:hypothetical protein